MKQVTEEMKPQEEWFERAKEIKSVDELAAFAKELLIDTQHDYGTVCHAIGALAVGAGWLGAHIQGITGFQAGSVMWDFVKQWSFSNNECGLRMIDFDTMLYPQYEYRFEKHISAEQFAKIQEVAAKRLKGDLKFVHPDVIKHWQSIVDGVVPFGYEISNEE